MYVTSGNGNSHDANDADYVLEERRANRVHPILRKIVSEIGPTKRRMALVLGDASLIQTRFLLNEALFRKVVVVDYSCHLLDDEIIPMDDPRLVRELSQYR